MKKITIILLFVFGLFTVTMAQTTSAKPNSVTSAKQDKATIAAQKKADRAAKAMAKKQAKESGQTLSTGNSTTAHLNKNGTPDKRFKANKQPTAAPQVQPQVHTQASVQTQTTTIAPARVKKQTTQIANANTVKTADKAISTDAEGRTIYQGPRGGKYYINKNGHKEYVK
ncbi:MAG: hypothetical protein ABI172_13635 [Ginsengibacter sp.]